MDKPVFYKDFEGCDLLIQELNAIKAKLQNPTVIDEIELNTVLLKQGEIGEKNVYYELKNSFIPMYALHNITIEHEDYSAQMDFVIITNNFICIIETKKLSGDIQINDKGEFIRTIRDKNGKFIKKEGMYSPITQNERHVRILKDLLLKEKLIKNAPVISWFVISNPKSVGDYSFAPKQLKNQIVKYDQLTSYLKRLIDTTNIVDMSIVTMQNIAEFLVNHNTEKVNPFINKYNQLLEEESNKQQTDSRIKSSEDVAEGNINNIKTRNVENARQQLIEFRKRRANEENIAAYYIFNNNQMEDMISKWPQTPKELLECNGFGK